MSRCKNYGLSLGGVLLVSAIMGVLALGMCRLSVAHLWLSSRANATLHASTLANSAASAAMAKILADQAFGVSRKDEEQVVLGEDPRRAIVTFSKDRAADEGVPWSTNNLEGKTAVEGSLGRTVQPGTVHVIATAVYAGSQRTVEAVLRLPPFPWAIVAGGTLRTRDNVFIGAIPDGVWPPPPDDQLLPADLVANASGKDAIVLSGTGTILGDVESPGEIDRENSKVVVKGEVRSGIEPVKVPQLEATTYDPLAMKLEFDDLAGSQLDSGQPLPLAGTVRRDGEMRVGGLELEGAHLFVNGDLIVDGPVSGKGVIACTGSVTIRDASLEGATELAILADKRVTVTGGGRKSSQIRGLIYAAEGMSVKDITVVGTVIAGKADANVELENAGVLAAEVRTTTISAAPAASRKHTVYLGVPGPNKVKLINRGSEWLNGFANVATERPSDNKYRFSIEIIPAPDGGYPLEVVVTPNVTIAGYSGSLERHLMLNDPANYSDLITQITWVCLGMGEGQTNLGLLHGVIGPLLQDHITPGGAVTQEPGEPAAPATLDVYGDLSRFLPFEDRARIVSWFER